MTAPAQPAPCTHPSEAISLQTILTARPHPRNSHKPY